MATSLGRAANSGLRHSDGESQQSPVHRGSAQALAEHPAVTRMGEGVTTAELVDFVASFSKLAQGRILGAGAEQYEIGGRQEVFEGLSFNELLLELVEELLDVNNYCAMLAAKVMSVWGAV